MVADDALSREAAHFGQVARVDALAALARLVLRAVIRPDALPPAAVGEGVALMGDRAGADGGGVPGLADGVGPTGLGQAGVDGGRRGGGAFWGEEHSAPPVRVSRVAIRAFALWSSVFNSALGVESTSAGFTDPDALVL